jgi:hypothetical protein
LTAPNHLLALLRRTLAEYATSRDPAVVLALHPLDVAARLIELAPPGSDIHHDALAAAGLLHWYRVLLLPAPDDEPDLDQALELFAQLDPEHADLIPPPVRQLLHREDDSGQLDPDTSRRLEICVDLLAEYRESHDPEVLRTAIALIDRAHGALPGSRPAMAALQASLHQLAVDQYGQYQRAGDVSALDDAIDSARASARSPHPGNPAMIARLANLSLMLCDRYDRRGRAGDLDEAIQVGRAAAALAVEEGPLPSSLATNLGLIQLSRFRHDRHLASLDEAVNLLEIAAARSDIQNRSRCLSNLAVALRARYHATGRTDDLDRAVEAARAAVAVTAPGDPERGRYLSNLAVASQARYELTRNADELDAAVDAARAAVEHIADDHPDRADRLAILAATLLQAQGQDDTAIGVLREAAQHSASRSAARVSAAQSWARSAAARGDFAEATAGFAMAVRLLPLLISREVTDRDQAFQRSGVLPGLTADAVASALSSGQPLLALELWEQGHGVTLDQKLQLRSDLSQLAAAHPALASRLADVRNALNAPAPTTRFWQEVSGTLGDVDRRMQLAREWDALVEQARNLEGFEDFLRPPRAEELLAAGADGPVVLINVSQYRSDALVVTNRGLEVVPLPDVSPERVQAMTNDFVPAFDGELNDRQRIPAILAWLWDAIARPVLTHLGLTTRNCGSEPTRLWWCPAGDLVLLPLHAAGQQDSAGQSALDLVVSSYTPTLRALLQARAHPDLPLSEARILAVGMPHASTAASLPYAAQEIQSITSRFPATLSLLGEAATRGAVLAAMSRNEIAHFACHGTTQAGDPSASGLLLTDGLLSVEDVLNQRLGPKELAILSACDTARSGVSFSDEPVHLASALQLAGYRHVIGTLQPVRDVVAAQMAERIYSALDQHGRSSRHVARALGEAVRHLRDQYPARPELWAPYIHIGP